MFRESALEEGTFKLKVVPELARHLSNKELGGGREYLNQRKQHGEGFKAGTTLACLSNREAHGARTGQAKMRVDVGDINRPKLHRDLWAC